MGKSKKKAREQPATAEDLARVVRLQDEFVDQWGALGSQWGINRNMAQVHALLMTSSQPLTTDDVMERLKISRGSASTNLRDLVDWGLLRPVVRRGDRKDYYEAEKDVWKMACTIARERKRREIEPTISLIDRCRSELDGVAGEDAAAFLDQLERLGEFIRFADRAADKVASSPQGLIMKLAAQIIR